MKPKKDRFIESAIYSRSGVPEIDMGGYLESKHGEMCFRHADIIEPVTASTCRMTRIWQRPGKHPFNTDLYRIRANP